MKRRAWRAKEHTAKGSDRKPRTRTERERYMTEWKGEGRGLIANKLFLFNGSVPANPNPWVISTSLIKNIYFKLFTEGRDARLGSRGQNYARDRVCMFMHDVSKSLRLLKTNVGIVHMQCTDCKDL